jgi:hypothetical protein
LSDCGNIRWPLDIFWVSRIQALVLSILQLSNALEQGKMMLGPLKSRLTDANRQGCRNETPTSLVKL